MVGLGIITCNRSHYFEKMIQTVDPSVLDHIVVVNDGEPYDKKLYPDFVHLIQHEKNTCVGKSKNDALWYLIKKDCDHLFLIEDDILIKKKEVFAAYIKLAKLTGLQHFNFAYHGPNNMIDGLVPKPNYIINGYSEDVNLSLNNHCVGAFSYYHRKVIEDIGYFDEMFDNSMEHVEHTYRAIIAGYHPSFWYFADLADSYEYLGEIETYKDENSIILKDKRRADAGRDHGARYFTQKYGRCTGQLPVEDKSTVFKYLAMKRPKDK